MNNQFNQRSSEKGQVLVLVVLGFVVLLGFVALAIDGSMVYSDRRFAQNASDASSLAGGGAAALSLENSYVMYPNFKCSDSKVKAAENAAETAAVSRAGSNDFTIDKDITDKHGVHASCGTVDNGSWVDKFIDINTWITSETRTSFAHFVFQGPMRNTVESVVRVRPRTSVAFGFAVVALRKDCPNTSTGGVHFDGNAELDVTGGGVFSNACLVAGGSVDVNVDAADGLVCTGEDCYTSNGSPSVSPRPEPGVVDLPESAWMVPAPTCPDTPASSHHGSGTLTPGNYTNIRVNSSNEVLDLKKGLYCISGDFVANGGTINGTGVTLYLTGGDFDIAGGVEINIEAPPSRTCTYCQPDVAYGPVPGVLIYLAEGNTGEASLLGTAESSYTGLVYAPSGMIEAGGTGSELETYHTQLVGDTVKLHGNTTIDIHFDDEKNYTIPSLIELYK